MPAFVLVRSRGGSAQAGLDAGSNPHRRRRTLPCCRRDRGFESPSLQERVHCELVARLLASRSVLSNGYLVGMATNRRYRCAR
jgi:hypothetical protein